ncbi:aminomethyl-transferring glycine dehydrogenase subunit GcvPB [Desulfatitalea alkaliphila]|uniref:glycine dehydrogenase (aminomethyl-transferring) n=1 Tax=Desulfatitalea alkaliphila TaxID=2929485 RepID=A0AA41R595_9BACT|nr:aminomethyl-transferring glycine dehydrogenase subunit GcvPB [Desulfatitalea alkaliphila]MCJ8501215.1 aminomethyl-transferring glycine dehydrogenase subunit GcvPB [Desulfatitalea alkaliphila]
MNDKVRKPSAEPLLWEMGARGRLAFSLPERDVPEHPLDPALAGEGPDFPDLSEPEIVRHYTRLSQWNMAVDTTMYPLGSCTMKYNPKTNDRQAALPGIAGAHPLLPPPLSQGLLRLMFELEQFLAAITGLPAVTLQPAAGAQGELTGMLIFHAYHGDQGRRRTKILIPDTAHGTNPASATLCGFTAVAVPSGPDGILEPEAVARRMDADTAGIMVTNPNTLGLFESHIREVADIVHAKGGLVYADGANMNAVMGQVDMGAMGVDVLHLNLHKTFSTPHGGGGPGAGPVCVSAALAPYLPVPRVVLTADGFTWSDDFPRTIGRLHAFYGNFGILVRAYSYILSLGADLTRISPLAVLNANYIRAGLRNHYHLPYDRPCMHECVFSDKHQQAHKVTALDIAKRLIDFGFHPPTIYFPLVVPGALMIEPTETETKETLDRFIAAMQAIAAEAVEDPERLRQAPLHAHRRRLDEVQAARKPCLTG